MIYTLYYIGEQRKKFEIKWSEAVASVVFGDSASEEVGDHLKRPELRRSIIDQIVRPKVVNLDRKPSESFQC